MHVDPASQALGALASPLSYAELRAEADRTARRLAALGVRPGDRVATVLPPGPPFAILLHASARLGTVLVPLDGAVGAGEVRLRAEDVRARVVVEEPLAGEEEEARLREWPPPQEPHSLLHTSGTTARPKVVVLTHGNHRASVRAVGGHLALGPADRWLGMLPVAHAGGLAVLLRAAAFGSSALLHERFDPDAALHALHTEGVTRVSLVPTMLRRLLAAGLERPPALRTILLGGGPMPAGLLAEAAERGLPVATSYGMTETASAIAIADPGGGPARPLAGVEVRIGPGQEVLVRGPMVSAGALAADGWLHTGDRGRLEHDGRLRVEGRLGDLIITGGENVAPPEVEEVLLAHAAVADAAVVGRPDAEWGQAVTAYVVVSRAVSDAELIAHCRARLAPSRVPKAVQRVERLPRTATGKLIRRAI